MQAPFSAAVLRDIGHGYDGIAVAETRDNRDAPLLRTTVDLIDKDGSSRRPRIGTLVTFAPKLKKEDGAIDGNNTAESIWLRRPGLLSMARILHFLSGATVIKISKVDPSPEITDQPPGTVMQIEQDAIHVAAGQGTTLNFLELQPENRSRLSPGISPTEWRPVTSSEIYSPPFLFLDRKNHRGV